MKHFENLSVAIIAGGKSRRFGEPKALARFGERSLLEHALWLAQTLTPEVMVITGENNFEFSLPVPSFPDIIPACGPLGGLYTALVQARSIFVATLPCDMPLLSAGVYRELYRRMDGEKPVVAVSHKGLEPLVAIWPRSALQTVHDHLVSRQLKLREVFQTLGMIAVPLPQVMSVYRPEMFHNVNTRQDLEELNELSRSSEPLLVP